jgi:hypothetical protein
MLVVRVWSELVGMPKAVASSIIAGGGKPNAKKAAEGCQFNVWGRRVFCREGGRWVICEMLSRGISTSWDGVCSRYRKISSSLSGFQWRLRPAVVLLSVLSR